MPLPHVSLNVATTADGKLAPATRHFIPFTTKRDQTMMLELRAENDAVMSGARTVDLGEVTLGAGGEKYRARRRAHGLKPEHIRVIVSGSGSLNPKAHIFTTKGNGSPIIILTTERAGEKRIATLRKRADAVHVSKGKNLNFREALAWLRKEWGVKKLLCEGGGEINGSLIEANVVNEIYLTLAPVIFGGRNAPTLADGNGIQNLTDAHKLTLKKMQRVGDELYTIWRVKSHW